MNSKDIKKLLRNAGVGGMFDKGLDMFDHSWYIPTLEEMTKRVDKAMSELMAEKKLISADDYAKEGGDCDTWTIIIWGRILENWMMEHEGQKEYPSLSFGFAWMEGHAANIAVTKSGPVIFNYGVLQQFDLKLFKKVMMV